MNPFAISTFVEQVMADAERRFGRRADAAPLERYAREAVLDLWLAGPRVTVYVADLALRRLRQGLERLMADGAAPSPSLGLAA